MGKKPNETPMDLEGILTVIANVAGWQQQLALEALQQIRPTGSDTPGSSGDRPAGPTKHPPDP